MHACRNWTKWAVADVSKGGYEKTNTAHLNLNSKYKVSIHIVLHMQSGHSFMGLKYIQWV